MRQLDPRALLVSFYLLRIGDILSLPGLWNGELSGKSRSVSSVMKKRGCVIFSKQYGRMFFLIVCGMMMTGCQTIRNDNALAKEQMLAAAGFQMKQAQTPEQLANVQGLPQRRLIPHTKDGYFHLTP